MCPGQYNYKYVWMERGKKKSLQEPADLQKGTDQLIYRRDELKLIVHIEYG